MAEALTPEQVGRVYDRIGRLQDWQSFYEGPAIRDLLAHGGFESASAVFELGCGTGALAERLLTRVLPADAVYLGVDVSARMVELARARLLRFGARATVRPVGGRPPLPGADGRFDRFVAVYVFDLLAEDLAAAMLWDARRLLAPGGRVCLVALAEGGTRASRAACALWNAAWRVAPAATGGCRPIDLLPLLRGGWRISHAATVTAWAITSQIVIASPPDRAAARATPAGRTSRRS